MSGRQAVGLRSTGGGLVVRLELTHAATLDVDRVPQVFGSGASGWLGEELPDAPRGLRSFLCDLELQAGGGGPTLFRKAAIVSIGEPSHGADGWTVPLEWRAASLSALFPVFAGQLDVGTVGIALEGRYAPPGGRLGYLLDVTLLGIAARQTGQWFMRLVADALA